MTVSRGLRRLLRIRELEEEQKRTDLESAIAACRRLEEARASAIAREQQGRSLVGASAFSGESIDRQAGLVESTIARRVAQLLEEQIKVAGVAVTRKREEFLTKRTERRQAETLIDEAQKVTARDAVRRDQQSLDDWYRGHRQR